MKHNYLYYLFLILFIFYLLFLDQDTTLVFPFPFLFSIELTQEFPGWKLPQNFYQLTVQEIPICYLFIVYHVTSI